ncbi:unnamed protein product [Rotaria socialis]|uniref:Uncharacterized protein n=1 Tax=Rotaria socialis TaxID=392032 RepID=A0A817SXQ2_9BILA|nr:unnamed protein product [Rotaria socialis]
MTEAKCSSFNTSAASDMDIDSHDQKDVSKLFTILRAKLNTKEKELLELQRVEPCLIAPDSAQIESLLNAISSLHLSTQEGSFIFASNSVSDNFSSTSVCPTGVNSIKILPCTAWLPASVDMKQKEDQTNQHRLPMVAHIFSLPANAFVASSSNCSILPSVETKVQTKDEPTNRLPMVSQLFSMPINAFRSSSSTIEPMSESAIVQIDDTKKIINNDNEALSRTDLPKSILTTETTYSKEYWLKKTSSESESVPLDLDSYIEQTTAKMRRLHMEYVEALEKLKTSTNPVDSRKALESIYPQTFDRMKPDTSTKNLPHLSPSNK